MGLIFNMFQIWYRCQQELIKGEKTMNILKRLENNRFELTTENGQKFLCDLWFEKKTNEYHVKLPKDNGSGRTYIRLSRFKNTDIYEFETKTEHREGMSYGSWKDRMTDEEKTEYEKCLKIIENIEKICRERKPKELTEEEKLQKEIDRLIAKRDKLRQNQ